MNSKKNIIKTYSWLTIIYAAAHIMLCLISGQWWDDWCYWTNGTEHLKEMYFESGMPLQAYNIMSVMWLPNWGYRIVVFFLFLLSGILFYEIIRNMGFLSDEDAFWMAAVAMTVPVNDARTILNCFGYSLELLLFMIAFFIVTKMEKMSGARKYVLRIVSLLILIYSYTMESLLVFTGLIWLYFFYEIWKKYNDEKLLFKVSVFFKTYGDYFVLPVVYYIVKGIYFKPYGRYAGYNSVTRQSLIKGTLSLPVAALKTLGDMVKLYLQQIDVMCFAVLAIVMILYLVIKGKNCVVGKDTKLISKKKIGILVLGFVVYYAGIFAYVVVRGGRKLDTVGVKGRDAMLAGFGVGIIVVAFCRMLPLRRTLQNIVPMMVVILGIFHFNDWYLNYQEDWYHQQELANIIEENDGFGNDNTILCDFSTASPVGATRFYSVNGMSYAVTGKMDKCYFSGIEELRYGLTSMDEFMAWGYNCDDYDFSDTSIDGVLFINNVSIENIDLLKMRYCEMYNPEKFREELDAITDYRYVKISQETSDRIYERYSVGELTSEVLWMIVNN